jgi:hypothetical protein
MDAGGPGHKQERFTLLAVPVARFLSSRLLGILIVKHLHPEGACLEYAKLQTGGLG